jgi:ERCC4-related helicase
LCYAYYANMCSLYFHSFILDQFIKITIIGFQVTLLVATSVAEEGLDIRQCNVVIRFDLAKTVLAYIQSRGRARKPGSDYILMLERYLCVT